MVMQIYDHVKYVYIIIASEVWEDEFNTRLVVHSTQAMPLIRWSIFRGWAIFLTVLVCKCLTIHPIIVALSKVGSFFFPSSTTLNSICREYVGFKTAIYCILSNAGCPNSPDVLPWISTEHFKEKAKNQLLKQRFYDISLFPACQLF